MKFTAAARNSNESLHNGCRLGLHSVSLKNNRGSDEDMAAMKIIAESHAADREAIKKTIKFVTSVTTVGVLLGICGYAATVRGKDNTTAEGEGATMAAVRVMISAEDEGATEPANNGTCFEMASCPVSLVRIPDANLSYPSKPRASR